MATTEQAYQKFLLKVDNNFENSIVSSDRGRFVLIFNEAQNKMVENILDRKKDDELLYIQKILTPKEIARKKSTADNADLFPIPTDYFDYSSLYSLATSSCCTHLQKVDLYPIKDDNKTVVLSDEFSRPDFLAREAPFTLASDNFHVYKDSSFQNEKIVLTYYRYPVQIRTLIQDDPESEFDPKFNPEFDDKFLDRIISLAASEFAINASDPKYQIDIQRAIQKI